MSEQYYDILFRGEVIDGFNIDQVKSSISQLFKAPPAKVEQLFSGKVVALKKGLDKPTALKFRQALENAGVKIYVKLAVEESSSDTTPKAIPQEPKATQPAASVDTHAAPADAESLHLDILPAGSDLLTETERKKYEEANIDISSIHLASVFDTFRISREPPPPAPDVSHISAAAVGADVLEGYHNNEPPPPAPDVDHISLAAAGADVLEGYHNEMPPPPVPDTDYISLAEVGADIDPTEKKPTPPAPDVSHIKLA